MELYFKTDKTLHELAIDIRSVLNISSVNQTSYQIVQSRYSDNFGGDYYIFEVLGLTLTLISNLGDIIIENKREYNYFLLIECETNDSTELLVNVGEHLKEIFISKNYTVTVDNFLGLRID